MVTYNGIMPMELKIFNKYETKFAIVDNWNYGRCSMYKWSISNGRSVCARVHGKTINLARYIMNNPVGVVDHIDGNVLNNLESNLRVVSQSENAQNREPSLGVTYDKDRNQYATKIRVNGKRLFLGRFSTQEEAAEAYRKAVIKYHGKFARGG